MDDTEKLLDRRNGVTMPTSSTIPDDYRVQIPSTSLSTGNYHWKPITVQIAGSTKSVDEQMLSMGCMISRLRTPGR
jgi:hypothetical protein